MAGGSSPVIRAVARDRAGASEDPRRHDLPRRQRLEELAVRAGRHRRGDPRRRRGHPQRVLGDRRDGDPRARATSTSGSTRARSSCSSSGSSATSTPTAARSTWRQSPAIEMACWDIVGKATGKPVHELLGGRVRDRVRVYANGWYRTDRTPEALRRASPGGRRARLHGPEVRPVRGRLAGPGPARGGPVDRHRRGGPRRGRAGRRPDDRGPQPIQRARPRCASPTGSPSTGRPGSRSPSTTPTSGAMVEVARRSPVPIATGESFTSAAQFADLMAHDAVHIFQPEPLHLGGLWRTRQVAAMADAHLGGRRPAQRRGPDLLGRLRPARRLHPELLRPGVVRRVQQPLDARDRRPAGPPARRLRRGADRARSRDRPRLGSARRPPVPARAPAPPVRARLGATRRRPDAGRRGPGRG